MPASPLMACLLALTPNPAAAAGPPAAPRGPVEAVRPDRGGGAVPQDHTLRYRFREGEVLRMSVANRHDQAFARGTQRQTVRQRTETEPQLTVVAVSPEQGTAVLGGVPAAGVDVDAVRRRRARRVRQRAGRRADPPAVPADPGDRRRAAGPG